MALKLQGHKLSIQEYMLPFCFRQKLIKKVLHFSQLPHFFICSHTLEHFLYAEGQKMADVSLFKTLQMISPFIGLPQLLCI